METRDQKTDRRSMRSKMTIIGAFAALSLEKDMNDITVTDIVEKANVGRTTFYAHFEDILDLHRYMFSQLWRQIEEQIEAILAEQAAGQDVYQSLVPSLALFKIAASKHAQFKLNAEHPQFGMRMLVQPLIARFEGQLEQMGVAEAREGIPHRRIALYLFNALIALLIDWVRADMPESTETMDRQFQRLAKPTLQLLVD